MPEAILESIRNTIEIYQNYNGSSAYLIVFLAAVFYLWFTEKDKSVKVVMVYLSASVFALFFFPLFAYLAIHYFLDLETYYRFLWLLPTGAVVSLAVIRLIDRSNSKVGKIMTGVCCAILIMVNGSLIYANPAVTKAENVYHLPQEVINVAKELEIEGTWVRAVVPAELVQFIRQYEGYITMPYGREMLIDRWEMNHDLYLAMEAETVHAEYVAMLCRENQVDYIVLRKISAVSGDFNEFGFEKIAETEMYHIYIDNQSMVYNKRMERMK